jgi:hypothetical protein
VRSRDRSSKLDGVWIGGSEALCCIASWERVLLFRLIPGCDNLGEILVLSVRVGGECLRQRRAGYGTVSPLSLSLE